MKYLNVFKLLCFGSLLTSCSNLTDCERNFIEGTGISERAYLSIQGDSEKFLTRTEVEQLIATIPLNGNSPRERSNNTFNSAAQLNACIKSDYKSFTGKTGVLGCYEGNIYVSDEVFEVQDPQENQKFSVQELAAAVREKYPQFEGYDDQTLVDAYIKKNPSYAERVDFGEPSKKKVATESPSTGETENYRYSPSLSREELLNQFRETTGLSKEETPDGVLAYRAAKLYPELKEMLGVETEGYEVDWSAESKKAKNKSLKKKEAKVKSRTNKSYHHQVSIDFDWHGYFVIYQEKKRYFDTNNEIQLRFKENLPSLNNVMAEVEIRYSLDRLKLNYEQIISTYQFEQLKSVKTTSGVLLKTTSGVCN